MEGWTGYNSSKTSECGGRPPETRWKTIYNLEVRRGWGWMGVRGGSKVKGKRMRRGENGGEVDRKGQENSWGMSRGTRARGQ